MGTRIGYIVRGNNDEPHRSPGLCLFSNEVNNDAEEIFRSLCKESDGPTDFMHRLSEVNVKLESGKELPIFSVDANHEDTEKTIVVTWERDPEGTVYTVFHENNH